MEIVNSLIYLVISLTYHSFLRPTKRWNRQADRLLFGQLAGFYWLSRWEKRAPSYYRATWFQQQIESMLPSALVLVWFTFSYFPGLKETENYWWLVAKSENERERERERERAWKRRFSHEVPAFIGNFHFRRTSVRIISLGTGRQSGIRNKRIISLRRSGIL